MTPRRLAAAFALPALLGPAGPATADPVVPIPMHVHVPHDATTFYACGEGTAKSATNVWVLHVSGVRTDTRVPDAPVINETFVWTGPTFDYCIPILKLGTAAGSFVVTFTYAGTGPDVTGTFGGWGLWAPGEPDRSGDTGIG